jgi:hypothetical protein
MWVASAPDTKAVVDSMAFKVASDELVDIGWS